MGPFDASPCDGATMSDIDEGKVRWFVKRARQERQHPREHFNIRSFNPVSVVRRREWFPVKCGGSFVREDATAISYFV